jgi:hypothetical protein
MFAITVCGLALWAYVALDQDAVRVEVFRRDPAAGVMTVVVDVINTNQQPATNVEVSIQNNSGGSSAKTTSNGRATISVGEPLVEGLRIDGTNINLGWRKLDATDGLRLVVRFEPH